MRGRALALAAGLLAAGACGPPVDRRPDVVLVTVDRLPLAETTAGGGGVQAPALAALEREAAVLEGLVGAAPPGAAALATVLTGLPPSGHGLRLPGFSRLDPHARPVAERFRDAGYRTGAVVATDALAWSGAELGFTAWDEPVPGFPSGWPGQEVRRAPHEVVAIGLQWLGSPPIQAPAFLALHLADPGRADADAGQRAQAIGDLDRMLGTLLEATAARERARGVRPIVVVVLLSTRAGEGGHRAAGALSLDRDAVAARAYCLGPRLSGRRVAALAGTDELAALLVASALGEGDSRLLALARGRAAAPRTDVVAESSLLRLAFDAPDVTLRVSATGAQAVAGAAEARALLPAVEAVDEAHALARRGEAEAAVAAFQRVAASVPGAPAPLVGLGLTLLRADRPGDALATFQRLLAAAPEGSPAWKQGAHGRSLALRAGGDAAAARAELSHVLEVDPSDLRALSWLLDAAEADGELDLARDVGARWLAAAPADPRALAAAGRHALRAGDAAAAVRALGAAVLRRPFDAALLLQVADACRAAGDYWTALDHLNVRTTVYGQTPEGDLALARIYHETGRWLLAGDFYRRVVTAAPSEASTRVALGDVLLRGGSEAEGRDSLRAAEDIAPASADACLVLGQWLLDAGRRDEARREVEACGARHAGDPRVAELLRRLGAT
jgi:tetratricopeptide (TPR) repeat protein